ncbi:MAG: tyrosine-type recombinase/integrase [Janthinobacterium lividum]
MSDPIAMRPVIGLKKSDVAAYRERLIAGGRAKSLAAAMKRLDEAGGPSAEARKADLRRLEGMRSEASSAGPARRRTLEREISEIHPLLPLVVRFAIATALRRERIFEFCEHIHVVQIGAGKAAIAFPRDATARRKRTGIIPVTREVRGIIDEAIRCGSELGPTRDGKDRTTFPINPVTFDHLWRRLVLDCELDGLHFHDLRHEATSRLFERGLTVAEVMSITGHSTTDMVDRYSHYSASLVLDKLDGRDDPERLIAEIRFLVDQYASMTGRVVDATIFRSPDAERPVFEEGPK